MKRCLWKRIGERESYGQTIFGDFAGAREDTGGRPDGRPGVAVGGTDKRLPKAVG